MGTKSGFGKLLTAIGIEETSQKEMKKKISEIGDTIDSVENTIFGNMADVIEVSKPWAKMAYAKAESGFDTATDMFNDMVQDITGSDSTEENDSKEGEGNEKPSQTNSSEEDETKPEKSEGLHFQGEKVTSQARHPRTPKQLKDIQDITAGIDYLHSVVIKCPVEKESCSGVSNHLIMIKQVLNNSDEPFEQLLTKGLGVLQGMENFATRMLDKTVNPDEVKAVNDINNSLIYLTSLVKAALVPEETDVDSEETVVDTDSEEDVNGIDLFDLLSVFGEMGKVLNDTVMYPKEESETKETEASEGDSEEEVDSEKNESASELRNFAKNIEGIAGWFEKDVILNLENISKETVEKLGPLMEKMEKEIKGYSPQNSAEAEAEATKTESEETKESDE